MNSTEFRATWSLASLFALRMLGLFMILPVFSIYGDSLAEATPQLIGLAIGAYGLTQAMLQIPFGFLSDRIGRKPVIVLGLVLFLIGSVVAAQAESIYGVIVGRALQGAGAIASAVMALLADLTSDQQRSKAMAMVGASIGLSFSLALIIGPIFTSMFELQGLFWLTAFLAACGVAVTIWVVPKPDEQRVFRDTRPVVAHFADVLKDRELARLDLGVFLLHMTLTASFVVLPGWLLKNAGVMEGNHWLVYLPVLFLSFVFMVPMMILAEKKRRVKQVFLTAIGLLTVSLLFLSQAHDQLITILIGLFVFFWGFNLLEALLPSLVSKIASPGFKGTSMGVYSTCQFLGAFVGGVGGGWVLANYGDAAVYVVAALLIGLWLLAALGMKEPSHLQSFTVQIKNIDVLDSAGWVNRLMCVAGVEEAVVVAEDKTAYLKVDNKRLDKEQLMQLADAV